MFASRVEHALLSDRLDAEHFRPDLLHLEREVTKCGLRRSTLDELRQRDATITYGIVQPGEFVADGAGVRIVRCTDLGDMSVNTADLRWVAPEIDRPYARSRVRQGDVLIGIAGSVGVVGIVPEGMEPANLNQSVARVRCRTIEVGHWTAAFLSSKYGQGVLARRAVGAVQQHLNLADLPDVPVPLPHERVVAYVGSKVRQAEVLRDWVRVRVDEILSDYAAAERKLPVTGRRHAKVPALTLRDRLDAEHYPDEVLQAFAGASSMEAVRLADVTVDIFSGSTLPAADAGAGVRQATVATLDRVFLNDRFRDVQSPRSVGRPFATHDLAIAAAAHTASYIGRDVTYVIVDEPTYPSTEVLVVRANRDRIPASWLWCFLKSPLGYRQVQACVRGITAHAYPDDICEVIVPTPPEKLRVRFGGHDEVMAIANSASVAARALVTAARLLVEALIERKITEAELMAAGKDTDADRALLARLAEDGLDGAGAPLFSDSDGLTHLLHEATKDR